MSGEPTPLWKLAKLVRAKNAGPFTITIDIMFDDRDSYDRVKRSGVLNRDVVARLYQVPTQSLLYTEHDAALSLKVSLPRSRPAGSIGETDVFGGQFHGPLVDVLIP